MTAPLAVIFDLWNTLIADPAGVSERREGHRLEGLAKALAGHGLDVAPDEVLAAYRAMQDEMLRVQKRGDDLRLAERVDVLLSHLGTSAAEVPALAAAVGEVFVAAAREVPPPALPGALTVVGALGNAGFTLGLISNTGVTPGVGLRHVLDGHGFSPHFRVLTFSDEAGMSKPSPAIYERTLEALAAPAADSVFVGDDPELDVAGPLRAGMWTVQVGDRGSDGVKPHAAIASLDELPEALKSLGLLDGSLPLP